MTETAQLTRRSLIKGTAAAGALILTGGVSALTQVQAYATDKDDDAFYDARGKYDADRPFDTRNKQFGFLVVAENCSNCEACVRACRKHNNTPDDMPARRKVTVYSKDGEGDLYVSTSCMHCVEPACKTVCPAGAITKGVGGIVSVNSDRCIGCKYCYQACPFQVPHYGSKGMDKCDCCLGNGVQPGQTPYCVRACKFDALHYGLIDELMQEYPEARLVKGSTTPSMLLA